jgi:hypothetical protein
MTIQVSGTTESLEIVLAAASATNPLQCSASWADVASNPDGLSVTSNGTTAVTLVPSPGSGVHRVVNGLSIYNADTANATVTVRRKTAAGNFTLFKVTLAAAWQLSYEVSGWKLYDSGGALIQSFGAASGSFINPMTTVDDIIVGGTVTAGVAAPVRKALGAIGTALGNLGGVLGYYAVAFLSTVNTYTKAQGVTPVGLTSGASIATNASLSNNFTLTLGVNAVLANPTNLIAGHIYNWVITQDATGGRTLTYGTLFKWPGGAAPVLSTGAAAVDFISAFYDGTRLLANFGKAYG